ncbi:PadR family transcriptional regulator [Pimelobacter simplex]|uniref:PadR family transcriptional regulator n=1 Tax=Nocardioides simplex TaxID=2045 RepID=A0A7J5E3N0_NOCSI|nr:PadR family transcriptional regulator [Pimelobacter simplex]KAB2812848.1 PadR family transcriptional regulator [Pimelobacter simplex]
MGRHENFNQYDDRDPWGRREGREGRGGQRRQRGGFGPGGPGGAWGGWAQWGESPRGHRGGPGGPGFGGAGFGGPGMPPPWLAGLFGMGRPEPGRGPRVRRGDVRSAILDVLREANQREESPNGYQVIQAITDRSGGVWKPSPGSVYPTVQQLQDEGLVEIDDEAGRRALRLTAEGATWCAEHGDELAAVWAPFDRHRESGRGPVDQGHADLKAEIGQVMGAIWQIVTAGSDAQRKAAVDVLVEARRSLYGILADGPSAGSDPADPADPADPEDPADPADPEDRDDA